MESLWLNSTVKDWADSEWFKTWLELARRKRNDDET